MKYTDEDQYVLYTTMPVNMARILSPEGKYGRLYLPSILSHYHVNICK